MLVIGLDLAFSRSGLALVIKNSPESGGSIYQTQAFKTRSGGSIFERASLIKDWAIGFMENLRELKHDISLVTMEGIAVRGRTSPMLCGLLVTVGGAIYQSFPQVPILLVPPLSLKHYIGVGMSEGKGVIVNKAWDIVKKRISSDEADALYLALLGCEFVSSNAGMGDEASISSQARMILYNKETNRKGQLKGLVYRIGEYFIPARTK